MIIASGCRCSCTGLQHTALHQLITPQRHDFNTCLTNRESITLAPEAAVLVGMIKTQEVISTSRYI